MADWAMNRAREDERILSEVLEFQDRFPDVSDEEIIDHIRYVFKKPHLHEESVLGKAIIKVYETQDIDAGLKYITDAMGGMLR